MNHQHPDHDDPAVDEGYATPAYVNQDPDLKSERQNYIDGLRQVAQFLADNPDVGLPEPHMAIYRMPDTREGAATAMRAFGNCTKRYDDSMFRLTKQFGGITLQAVFYRSSVCERKVVGKKIIPAVPAQPEKEVDLVEWVCNPILGDIDA